MAKRAKLEIIRDILTIIKENHGPIKPTPLLRRSNISTARFKGYLADLLEKGLVKEAGSRGERLLILTDNGIRYLERYKTLITFIEEFDL